MINTGITLTKSTRTQRVIGRGIQMPCVFSQWKMNCKMWCNNPISIINGRSQNPNAIPPHIPLYKQQMPTTCLQVLLAGTITHMWIKHINNQMHKLAFEIIFAFSAVDSWQRNEVQEAYIILKGSCRRRVYVVPCHLLDWGSRCTSDWRTCSKPVGYIFTYRSSQGV